MTNSPLIGAHVSVAGGLYKGVENATRIGAEAIQIFGASPRQWAVKMPSAEEVGHYKKELAASNVKAVFLHAAYLINLSSTDEPLWKKSIECLSGHLKIAEMIGAQGVVFHIHSIKGLNKKIAHENTAEGMEKVLAAVPGKAQLIMENNAGEPARLGSTIEDLALLMKSLKNPRVKICLDTAHTFESGMIESYSPAHIKKLFDAWDDAVGVENIAALHANDSKTPHLSHSDRHENIGEGYIGLKGFQALAKEKRLAHTAWLLEVPGYDNEGPDKKNVDILRGCF